MSSDNTTSGDDKTKCPTTSPGSDPVQFLCTQLFRKELIKPPSTYVQGSDVLVHLQKVEEFIKFTGITSEEEKVYILLESLHEDLQKEMRMTRDFQDNKDNFSFVSHLMTRLYHSKTATITPFVRLLKLTQKTDQSVEEFAREIRIRAFDCIYNCSPDDREDLMLECFVNGLKNDIFKIALRHIKPNSLDEAVKLIKKEEKSVGRSRSDTVEVLDCTGKGCQAQINDLKKEIVMLKREVLNLRNEREFGRYQPRQYSRVAIQQGERRPSQLGRRFLPQRINGPSNRPRGVCYNCKRPGHFASTCRLPRKCFSCGQSGHISKFCKQINQLVSDDIDSNVSSNGNESGQNDICPRNDRLKYDEDFPVLSVSNRFRDLGDEGQFIRGENDEQICLAECDMLIPKKRKEKCERIRQGQSKSADEQTISLIDKQVAFIEGKGPKPLQYGPEYKQRFLNKPIVKCRVNGDQMNTLMDSGATCNLITKEVFDGLREKDNCQLLRTHSRISCANNSCMKCYGEVGLHFSLAGKTTLLKFFVVDELNNSQVILGLRTMKRLGIKFDFERDCLIMNNIVVPFESNVIPSTTVHHPGN